MSCIIMNHEALAVLANAIEHRLVYSHDYWGVETPGSLFPALCDCMNPGRIFSGEAIYIKLYMLNVQAHNECYKEHEKPAIEQAPDIDIAAYRIHHRAEYQERHFVIQPWHYYLARLLDFWIYQTNEKATRNAPLRLAVLEFRDSLYEFIVMNSPPYYDVRWGTLPPCDTTGARRRLSAHKWLRCWLNSIWHMISASVSNHFRKVCENHDK